jgi:hypothetical protein
MIPPFTGNGMSMAFESAELAVAPLLEYSQGLISWEMACRTCAWRVGQHFRRRLRHAHCLHRLAFTPLYQRLFLWVVSRSELAWRAFFFATR